MFPNPKFPPNSEAILFAMASISANDIWAVGDFLQIDKNLDFNLFEHWDGTTWTATTVRVTKSPFESLSGASADATNDAWAVGFQGFAPQILAKHWDGTKWRTAATPQVAGNNNKLNAVLALAPNDAWAVGFSTPAEAGKRCQSDLDPALGRHQLEGSPEPERWTEDPISVEHFAGIDGQFSQRYLGVWFLLRIQRVGTGEDSTIALGRFQLEDCPQSQSHQGRFPARFFVFRSNPVARQRLDFWRRG